MEKFYHPSGLRFLENKDLPFISLNKIIELSKKFIAAFFFES